MPLVAQLCLAVVTIALFALAVVAVRLMLRTQILVETATRSLAELPALIEEAKRTSSRAGELLLSMSRVTQSAHSRASQVASIMTRTGAMTTRLLDEIEQPLARAIGVMRGVRSGASLLFRRWQEHFENGDRAPSVPGQADERWSDDGGRSKDLDGRPRDATDFHDYGS